VRGTHSLGAQDTQDMEAKRTSKVYSHTGGTQKGGQVRKEIEVGEWYSQTGE
jgi:hypothetical protein